MAEITDLLAIDNNNVARWPEGMQFAQVNNAARADEGILARWYLDANGSLAASGPVNAYAITANRSIVSYLDKLNFAFVPNSTNTGSATLNVSGLGAITITRPDGSALLPGDIVSGQVVWVVYIASAAKFQLMNLPASAAGAITLSVGTIMIWPTEVIPTNCLECNGQSVAVSSYPALFAQYGYRYGGSGANFNLPDYRGYFLRGQDHGAGRDPDAASRTARADGTAGDNPGTTQADAFRSHNHTATVTDPGHSHNVNYATSAVAAGSGGPATYVASLSSGGGISGTGAAVSGGAGSTNISVTNTPVGGNETRPLNINVRFVVIATPGLAVTTFTANPGTIIITAPGINMNAVADTTIPVALPPGFTRYRVLAAIISHASTDLTAATAVAYGLFTGTGGTGTAVVSTVTSTVSQTAENTANNIQSLSPINASLNVGSLFFRVSTAHGAAATADLTLVLQLLP